MTTQTASTQDDLRRLNRAGLLRYLHQHGASSRSDLVAHSGLNRSTVGAVVAELAEAGLVSEEAGVPGQVGRPSLQVHPVAESAIAIAFDLKVESTIAALVGVGGEVLWRRELRHRRVDYSPTTAVRTLVSLTHQALRRAPEGAAWVGVGVGVPGIVDYASGVVRQAPNLGWVDAPLAALLRQALLTEYGFAPQVSVGNDADLGALAEHVRGVGSATRNLIYVSGEVGIGGGVIIDGRPMLGAGGYGGEVGHMIVNPSGLPCRCGARGCWETEIGHDAIMRAAGLPADTSMGEALSECEAGSKDAQAAVDLAGQWLGIGLANLVNLFNPEVIVLGGHLRLLYPQVSATVLERIQRALPATREQVHVEVPALNGESTLLGAAEAAFEPLLTDPIAVMSDSAVATAS